jgi:hypothetical protein
MLSSLAPLKEARLLFQRSIQTRIKDKGMERHTGMMEVNCCAPNAAPVFRFNGILLPAWL